MLYNNTYAKVVIECCHNDSFSTKLWPKARRKIKAELPEGWSMKALAGYRGVGFYCVNVTKLGDLKPEWIEGITALLNLITVTA